MQQTIPQTRDEWSNLLERLPKTINLEESAFVTGALKRKRKISSARDLLRLILIYCTCHLSLRSTALWAQRTALADISDVAVLKRVRQALPWLKTLLAAMVNPDLSKHTPAANGHRLYLIDATYIKGQSKESEDWRIHSCYDPASGSFEDFTITDTHGAESAKHFSFTKEAIVIGDRAYAKAQQLKYIIDQEAHFIVRTALQSCCLQDEQGQVIKLPDIAKTFQGNAPLSIPVFIASRFNKPHDRFPSRLIVAKLSEAATLKAIQQVKRKGQKNQRLPQKDSFVIAGYFFLLTSLPETDYSTKDVLRLYRIRWQIELAFKRLKSLGALDKLKAKSDDLAGCCLYAGLIIALLVERFTVPFEEELKQTSPHRTPSLWRIYTIAVQQIRAEIIGCFNLLDIHKMTAVLWRNICEPPRKRQIRRLPSTSLVKPQQNQGSSP